jgi:hypothetical protein
MEPLGHLVPGVDYPQTFQEFDALFASGEACREHIRRLRWPRRLRVPPLRVARADVDDHVWPTSRHLKDSLE